MNDALIDRAEDILAQLTDTERMEVFGRFCIECGAYNPDCWCWVEMSRCGYGQSGTTTIEATGE